MEDEELLKNGIEAIKILRKTNAVIIDELADLISKRDNISKEDAKSNIYRKIQNYTTDEIVQNQ